MGYISYLRVSTKGQEISGLGLEAQREAVLRAFGTPIHEYIEIESGKSDSRPELHTALAHAKDTNNTLVIAKLDRLSRNVSFIANLMDSGVNFKCADMPQMDKFTAHIISAVAQREREMISQRTKAALAVKKSQGIKLGAPNAAELMRQNRVHREYKKLDPKKVDTMRMFKADGYNAREIQGFSGQMFGKPLSIATVYKYLRN
jgi:DNA invertase Pin-like site-specific DNA recombinase